MKETVTIRVAPEARQKLRDKKKKEGLHSLSEAIMKYDEEIKLLKDEIQKLKKLK